MLSILYYIIISVLALLLLANLATKKKSLPVLVSIALVAMIFALRALHIK